MKTLVLGMGNTLLGDDAIGIEIVRELERTTNFLDVEFKCSQAAGFRLLDNIVGFEKAIVVDAIVSGKVPAGEVYWFDIDQLNRPLLYKSNHNIHLADAIRLGETLGFDIPNDLKVLAIEVEDCFTFSEKLSSTAKSAIPKALKIIITELNITC